jgi:hypothetical protein
VLAGAGIDAVITGAGPLDAGIGRDNHRRPTYERFTTKDSSRSAES